MAQAARLNLRMQKELKLLISDPPHGATFPLLSADSAAAVSLSSIDALIQGPEGSVYGNGVFHVKIQIPELYPFQPPSVTFGTPIYHPNIDTGGRICLDILNLPPKGAWQPSLNISTVLTSIGLLLSEPNPDDGLMCEASKEYKYNRQIFDQKARSMTEKYAQNGSSSQSILSGSRPSTMDNERLNLKSCEADQTLPEKMSLGLSRKLSLDPSSAKKETECIGKSSKELTHLSHPANCAEQMEYAVSKYEADSNYVNCDNLTDAKLSLTRRKLSLNYSDQIHHSDEVSPRNVSLTASYSDWNSRTDPMACSETSTLHSATSNHHIHHDQEHHKQLSLISKKPRQVIQQQSTASEHSTLTAPHSDVNSRTDSKTWSETSTLHSATSDHQTYYDQGQHKRLGLSLKKPHQVIQQQSMSSEVPTAGQVHILSDTEHVKLSSKDKKLPLRLKRPLEIEDNDNKENLTSRDGSVTERALGISTTPSKSRQISNDSTYQSKMKSGKHDSVKLSAKTMELKSGKSPIADSIIVLDSEDSDEDFRPVARKPLGRKWRSNV